MGLWRHFRSRETHERLALALESTSGLKGPRKPFRQGFVVDAKLKSKSAVIVGRLGSTHSEWATELRQPAERTCASQECFQGCTLNRLACHNTIGMSFDDGAVLAAFS